MSFDENLGVSISGVSWDVGDFKLYQSTRDDVILYAVKQPYLAKVPNGRFQFSLNFYKEEVDNTNKITGGTSVFTISTAPQYNEQEIERLESAWRTTVVSSGKSKSENLRFMPLRMAEGNIEVLMNEFEGVPHSSHRNALVGVPGGTNSFLINLTEQGAQAWASCIKEKKPITAGIKFSYKYLQWMPTVGAKVTLNGRRVFRHLSTAFNVSYNGFFYASRARINTEWEKMQRNGDIEVTFIGTSTPEIDELRNQLVSTFATQAQEQWFNMLFQPSPEVDPTTAGRTGWLGGASYALKWKKEEEAVDLDYTIKFKGWSWIFSSFDISMGALLYDIDDSYISQFDMQVSVPARISVDGHPLLESAAISWAASEGKAAENPIFYSDGGAETYLITSQNTQDVVIKYNGKLNYKPEFWPIINVSGEAKYSEGGENIVIQPSDYIGKIIFCLMIREGEGDELKPKPTELTKDDYLTVNLVYTAPYLVSSIKTSARLTTADIIEYYYPKDPNHKGELKLSAFGVIGGNFVKTGDNIISLEKETVLLWGDTNGVEITNLRDF